MARRLTALLFLFFSPLVWAQEPGDAPLVADPERDRFTFANLAYERAERSRDATEKAIYYRKAVQLFSEFLSDFPRPREEAQVRYRLGTSYLYTGQPESAARQFRSILDRSPNGHIASLAAYRLASLRYERRDFSGAAPYFATSARAAEQAQLRHRALYFEANCYILAKNERKAREAFLKLVNDPERAKNAYYEKAALQVALMYQEEEDYEKALEYFVPLLTKGSSKETIGQALVGAGLASAKLDQPEQAKLYLETVLKSSEYKDYHLEAQAALMETAYLAKNYAEVFSIYRQRSIPAKGKVAAKLHLMAGKAAMAQDRFADGRDIFLKAERAFPQSDIAFDAAFRRVVCFFESDSQHVPVQVDAFEELYGGSQAGSKEIQLARLMKAETLFAKEDFRKAARVYNRITSRLLDEENRASMLHHKGWSLSESGDPNGAVQAFSEFLSSFPDDSRALETIAKRGESFLAAGNFESALKDFDTIIEKLPGQPLAALALQQSAEAQRKQDNLKDMVVRYDKLINDYPDLALRTKANAYYWIGWAMFKEDKYLESAEKLNEARKLDPANFNDLAGTRIVLAYYMAQDVDKLLVATNQIRKDIPGKELPPRVLTWLGIKSFERRDFESAVTYLNLVTNEDDPSETSSYIWKHLAKASVEIGDYTSALNAIEKVVDSEEHPVAKADALLDKGQAHLGLGQFAEAVSAVEKGLELQGQGKLNAELQLLLGDIAFGRKDYSEAAKKYVVTAELVVDRQLTPIAIYKAIKTLELNEDEATAKIYRDRLKAEYPNFTLNRRWIRGPEDL